MRIDLRCMGAWCSGDRELTSLEVVGQVLVLDVARFKVCSDLSFFVIRI